MSSFNSHLYCGPININLCLIRRLFPFQLISFYCLSIIVLYKIQYIFGNTDTEEYRANYVCIPR